VQVALALVLLICSGLMIRTFRALTHVNPGFSDPATLQTFHIGIPENQIKDDQAVVRSFQSMLDKLAAIPGVSSVAISTQVPMDGNSNSDMVFAEDHPLPEGKMPGLRRFAFVVPGLFATQGTPLIAGRDFTWDDVYQKRDVAIICEGFAREFWGSPEAALGKRIRVASTDDWREIIGIATNVYSDGVNQRPSSMVYWPIMRDRFEGSEHELASYVAFQIRSPRSGAESFMNEVRQAVWSVNPNLPLSAVHTLDYYYTRSMARTSFTLIMLAVAAGMALLLGVVGIYGVIAYAVSQRTREIGIRMALGAQTQVVTSMFVRHGVLLTAIGVAFGLVASFITMRLMSSLLFHVQPIDPLTYGAVTLGLLATAFLASYFPSRRAATVDPVDALRAE
jgi:predicted permease